MSSPKSFYEAARAANPIYDGWSDRAIYQRATTLADSEKIEDWKNRFPDYKERHDMLAAPKKEESGGLSQYAGAFAEGMSRMGWDAVGGVSRNLADISRVVLGDDNFLDSVEDFADDVSKNYINDSFGVTEDTRNSFGGQLAAGAGQLVGQVGATLAGGAVGKGIGLGAKLGSMITGGSMAAGQMDTEAVREAEGVYGKAYNDFNEEEKSRTDKMRYAYAAVGAVLENVGVFSVASTLFKKGAGKVAKGELVKQISKGQLGKAIAKGFFGEGTTEAAQGQALDQLAKTFIDQDRDTNVLSEEVFNKRLLEFTLGGILGGGAGGVFAKVENASALEQQTKQGNRVAPEDSTVDPFSEGTTQTTGRPTAADSTVDPFSEGTTQTTGRPTAAELVRNVALQEANKSLSQMEQDIEDRKFNLGENQETLDQFRQDFPEYQERIDDILKTQVAPPETREERAGRLSGLERPQRVKRVKRGRLEGAPLEPLEPLEPLDEAGTFDPLDPFTEDKTEGGGAEPEVTKDAASASDTTKEVVIRPKRVVLEPNLMTAISGFAKDHLYRQTQKEVSEGNMRLIDPGQQQQVVEDVVDTLRKVLMDPHAEGAPSLEEVLGEYAVNEDDVSNRDQILGLQEEWLAKPENQKSTQKVATLEEGGPVEWTARSGKIVKGKVLGISLGEGDKGTIRVFDGRSEYEFPMDRVRPVNSTNAQAVKEKTITPERKTLLPSTKKWISEYAFNHSVYRINRALNAQQRGEPFDQADIDMAFGGGFGKNKGRSARRTQVITDVEAMLTLALTKPHTAPSSLQEVLDTYPIVEPGTNQETVLAPHIEQGKQVASELGA